MEAPSASVMLMPAPLAMPPEDVTPVGGAPISLCGARRRRVRGGALAGSAILLCDDRGRRAGDGEGYGNVDGNVLRLDFAAIAIRLGLSGGDLPCGVDGARGGELGQRELRFGERRNTAIASVVGDRGQRAALALLRLGHVGGPF
jgi:hypothetical protein